MSHVERAPQSRCLVGVCEGDITPPVGIYHRMWGAATHDRATGVHRPLRQTTLALAPLDAEDPRAEATVFVGLDHCLLWHREMQDLLEAVSQGGGVSAARIVVFFSHTHAAGLMGYERENEPGGEGIQEYLERVGKILSVSVTRALEHLAPASIVYGVGRCDLARNRDFFDPQRGEYVCGYHPDGTADETLVVGRVTDERTGRPVLTIVNYACHPTTLAWENTQISPDYVGAMRELIEQRTSAPVLFVQGASGDLGPREGYVGDLEVADRNGRRLGYAVLSALESLPPPGMQFEYAGAVVSGATLGTWRYAPADAGSLRGSATWIQRQLEIDLPYRSDLPQRQQLLDDRAEWLRREQEALRESNSAAARDARAMVERAARRLTRVGNLPPGDHYPFRWNLLRVGDAVWIALEGEHYNVLQRQLRREFEDEILLIGTLANGSRVWYLPDESSYGKGLYQETASILARGSLERLIDDIAQAVRAVLQQYTVGRIGNPSVD